MASKKSLRDIFEMDIDTVVGLARHSATDILPAPGGIRSILLNAGYVPAAVNAGCHPPKMEMSGVA